MKISLIVAAAKNNVIGDGKKLLWHIPGDLPRFKQITTGHHILMGRKTYDSIGRILPNRTNLIVSSNKNLKIPGAFVFNSFEEAEKFAQDHGESELMIIGGTTAYKYFISKADKIYLTRVFKDYKGNAVFPEINLDDWNETSVEKNMNCDPTYEVVILTKKS